MTIIEYICITVSGVCLVIGIILALTRKSVGNLDKSRRVLIVSGGPWVALIMMASVRFLTSDVLRQTALIICSAAFLMLLATDVYLIGRGGRKISSDDGWAE